MIDDNLHGVHRYGGSLGYLKWTIYILKAHEGAEYYVYPKIFEGKRKANNAEQALEWAKQDCDTNGEAHGWRARGEGAPGAPEVPSVSESVKVCVSPQKFLMLRSFSDRVRRSILVLLGKG